MLKKAILLLLICLLMLPLFACGETPPPAEPNTPEQPSGNEGGSGNNGNTNAANEIYDWNFLSDEGLDKDRMTEAEIEERLERQQFRWEITYGGVLTLKGVCTEMMCPTFYDETDQPWRDFTSLQSNDAGDGRPVLRHVRVEPTVMALPENAFKNCAELETVTLSTTLSKIPDYCFAGCEVLTSVTGGMGIIEIGEYALSRCSKLQRLELTECIAAVGLGAFDKSCDALGTDSATGEKKKLLIHFRGDAALWTSVVDAMTEAGNLSTAGNAAFLDAMVLFVG